MDPSKIEHCVEIISQKGCTEVLGTIEALEQGQPVVETSALSADERLAVLAELKSVMAVYQIKK